VQVIQSAYTFIWDVLMDWGLPAREPPSAPLLL